MKQLILTVALLFAGDFAFSQYYGVFEGVVKTTRAEGRIKKGRAGIDICNNGPLASGQTMCANGSGTIGYGADYTCSNWCNLAAPNNGCRASAGSNGLNASCQAWCTEVAPNCNPTTTTEDSGGM